MRGYVVDGKRIVTMLEKLGEAADLIDDRRFLPMFRNRQKKYGKMFNLSIKLAKKKNSPSRYFASIWSRKSLSRTLDYLGDLVVRKAKKSARATEQAGYLLNSAVGIEKAGAGAVNLDNIARFKEMKRLHGLA